MLPEPSSHEPYPGPEALFIGPALLPEERVIRVATISNGIYWKAIAMMLASLLVLLFAFRLAVYIFLVGFVMLLLAFSTKHALLLVATNKRLIVRWGIINQDTIELSYPKIESIEVAWSPMGQILGYATIFVTGTGRMRFSVPYVENAASWRDDLMQQLMEKEPLVASGSGV